MKRELRDMTLEELWEMFPIVIVPHNRHWKEWAEDEIKEITGYLSDFCPVVSHIGSTAISDIKAKPIIDILVEVSQNSDWNMIRSILEVSGYICMSVSENRMSFNKGYTSEGYAEKVFHVHVRASGDNDEILFRDYLRSHPATAHEYEILKRSLMPKYKHDRDGYTEAKSEFVRQVTELAKSLNKKENT